MGDYADKVDDENDIQIAPTPRRYQVELAEKAKDENVIVVLETGCGKTLISIMLMRELASKKNKEKVCVFLAPQVVLVHQQAKVIEKFTDLKVGIYCGHDAKHLRTHVAWEEELLQHNVLVMTPQVLLHCLCHCFIRMDSISLLIFDECHYAQIQSNHPYAEIMKLFYHPSVRIFGMTASPICGKGASIHGLQSLLHAKVYTVDDKTELEAVVVSPVVQVYHYSSLSEFSTSHTLFLDKLEGIKRQCTSMLCRIGDDPSRLQNAKKLLQRLHYNMVFTLTSLGFWGALQACRVLLNGDAWAINEQIDAKRNASDDFLQNEYIVKAASLLQAECIGDFAEGTTDMLCNKLLKEPFFSQKVLRLVGILSNFRSRPDMKCIIFVNRIIIARALAYVLGQMEILSCWKCNYLVGVHSKRMSRNTMCQILKEFRSGKLNLLVATKVGEEGLDIQTCCLVIRFDLPETLASFIQSRGRARMPQSEYAFLVDSENEKEMNLIDSFRKDEDIMNMDIRDRKPNGDGVVVNVKEEVFSVNLTGATISAQTSISLLYHYCSKLPHDEYFNPVPNLYYVDDPEGIKCHIILPSNAPIHDVVGAPRSNVDAAKRDACLEACKKLHEIGALSDYLLPETETAVTGEEAGLDFLDCSDAQDEESSFVLQEMVVPAVLKEPWSDVDNLVRLSSYFIRFEPRQDDRLDREYKEFGLFLKAPLPCEAEKMKIDLHLSRGRSVLTDLVPCGVIEFKEEEMLLALNFQEMCLKLILDRSNFMCDHVPLMAANKASESNSSSFYLMLPVIPPQPDTSISVDWMLIKRCLSSPIFAPLGHLGHTHITSVNHLQLADGPSNENDVLNSLVYVPHRKSFFFVSQILHEMNGFSFYNSSTTSHMDHWSNSCDIHLSYPEQPLLQVKQLFRLHNLLHDRKSENSESRELEEHFFEIPAELCELKIIGFSKDIGSTLSLLPSIMHRMENLLVAIELKDMLSRSFAEGGAVTAERVLEALTTQKCQERFSLERLEVLGDAFLKFAVGRYLFLKHETLDEGKLTRRRSNLVNNSNLYKLAIKNKLQGYIRDQEFVASQFFALGRPCPIICTKEKEHVIHCESEVTMRNRIDNHQAKCSKNHLWMTKKTIADVVEALVGAYIVDSGFKAAIAFLKWFGIQVEFEVYQVCKAWTASSKFMSLTDYISIPEVENIMGHQFVHKGLILQAFVHPSYNRHGGGCYQRLEFLGDAVLDYLITSYLYSVFPDLKPGQLTDLRSSLVNNSSFARVAAKDLHKFIICDNRNLCVAIDKFVAFLREPASERHLLEDPPCPKALGDLVESCMGAVLLDSGFDLNHVWKVMFSFLYPVMRFTNLELSPIRELLELCQHHDWDIKFMPSKFNKGFKVEAIVEGKDLLVTAAAIYRSTSGAKRMAAQQAIENLKAQGYRLKSKSLEEILKTLRKMEPKLVGYDEIPLSLVGSLCLDDHSNSLSGNPKLNYGNMNRRSMTPNGCASLESQSQVPASLMKTLTDSMSKLHVGEEDCTSASEVQGGLKKATAKSQLMELCVKNCWGRPVYECYKEEGASHLRLFSYKVEVIIEEAEDIRLECYGGPQSKKKAAAEEAAEGALWFLKEEGYIK